MVFAVAGYAMIAGFFALEFFARKGSEAKSLEASAADRGTTILIGLAYGASILLAPILNLAGIGRIAASEFVSAIAIAIMILGLAVRLWAMRTLGGFYTRTLRVSQGQTIVEEGPYRLIRHPGYLGTLLLWIGLPLTLGNWVSALIVSIMMAFAYRNRMRAEEAMLIEAFGDEYLRYMQRTRRLVPFIL